MSSKQINFFIMPSDVSEINSFLKEMGCLFVKSNVIAPAAAFIDNIETESKITKQYYLCPLQYKNDVVFKQVKDEHCFYVDINASNVIEFDIGGLYDNDEQLHRSRLYYVTAYYDKTSKLTSKENVFVKWADKLAAEFKKRFLKKYSDATSSLFSADSIKWCVETKAKLKEGGLKLILQNS